MDTTYFTSFDFKVQPKSRSYETLWCQGCPTDQAVTVGFGFVGTYQQVQFLFYLNQNIVTSSGFLCERSGRYEGSIQAGGKFNSIRVQVRNVTDSVQTSVLKNMHIIKEK
jgi:hypothetical protein